jgi:hypothetical protein
MSSPDTTTEAALMIANQLDVLVIFDEVNSINSLGKEASALIRALVAERDEALKGKQRQVMMTIAAEARVKALEEALWQCAYWFQEYEASHTAKGDTDKAKRNQDRADFARAALEGK